MLSHQEFLEASTFTQLPLILQGNRKVSSTSSRLPLWDSLCECRDISGFALFIKNNSQPKSS
jgi:hypothetical protein